MIGQGGARVALIAVAVVAAAVGAVSLFAAPAASAHPLGNGDLFVLALAAALGDHLVLPRNRGRSTTMSIAVIACVALLSLDPRIVAAVAGSSWVVRTLRAVRDHRDVRLASLVADVLMAWGLTGFAALVAIGQGGLMPIGDSSLELGPVAVVWGLLILGSPAAEALEMSARAARSRRMRYRDLVVAGLSANVVLAATATLGALAYPELGWPTVLLMALPLLAAKLGFDRNAETRTTYDQTLRAMSRLPEQLGAVDAGHGVRSGELAALTAVELGFGADDVVDIERAAQLHELGRIRTEDGLDLTPEEVAAGGASIVSEAGELDRVAALIAAHRGPVPVGDEAAWVGGAIVRLACELDLRLTSRGEPLLLPSDESWVRSQGVEARIAEAVIVAAHICYAAPALA